MKKRTRSILEELNSIHRTSLAEEFIQSTGINIIDSAVNLLNKVYENYDEDVARDLERRFLNSIRAGSSKKFKVGVDKIIESKK